MPFDAHQEQPEILSREERVLRFGVDCVSTHDSDGICFGGGDWAPGGEYIRKLRVKNVSTRTVKLKYRLPLTRYFSMGFPEVINLSPGMVKEIDVAFRPVQYENYDDTIYFRLIEDNPSPTVKPIGFHVPVKAIITSLSIRAPRGLDFGYCTVNELSTREFVLVNTGQVPAPFRWEVPSAFTFDPMEGVIPVNGTQTIQVQITPKEASVFVCSAVCHVGEGVNAIKPEPVVSTKISAIGKYPHVTLSELVIDFGDVQVGMHGDSVQRDFLLQNHGVVPVSFKLVRQDSDCDCMFKLWPTEGVVHCKSDLRINVSYLPQAAGTFSCENFMFITPGGNAPSVQVLGYATGPGVTAAKTEKNPALKGKDVPNSLNFSDVRVGQSTTRVLFMYNRSTLPAHFNFVFVGGDAKESSGSGGGSVFRFSRTRGVIPAGLDAHINIEFSPISPANYYRRVFCLVEHQHPLYIDVFGSGYIPAKGEVREQRPAPLRHAHIQAFRNRAAAGMGHLSPEELDRMLEEDGVSDFFAHHATKPMATSKVATPVTRSGEATRNEVAVSSEFFLDVTDTENSIALDSDHVDFGFSACGASQSRSVRVVNRTNAKVTAEWTEAPHTAGDAGFRVDPPTADIAPQKAAEFTVFFEPGRENTYYSRPLEVIAYYKSQRSFRLVNSPTMSPPWMLTLGARGHSFPRDQFLAKVALHVRHHRLTFPACHLGDAVYQTIRIDNTGNLPAAFELKTDPATGYSAKPWWGIIPAESFQLVELRFRPHRSGMHTYDMVMRFNNCDETSQKLHLMGLGQVPTMKLLDVGDEGIFIKPTAVGLLSTVKFRVQNQTRVPLVFALALQDRLRENFSVAPAGGRLKGKEAMRIELSFAPGREKTYVMSLPILVKSLSGPSMDFRDAGQIGQAGPSDVIQTLHLKVLAATAGPAVLFRPPVIDLGVLLVNDEAAQEMTLVNTSDSDVTYELQYAVYGKRSGEPAVRVTAMTTKSDDHLLTVDLPRGVLPARSTTITRVTFKPDAASDYRFAILANLRSVDQDGHPVSLTPSESALLDIIQRVRSAEATQAQLPEASINADSRTSQEQQQPDGSGASAAAEQEQASAFLPCRLVGKATFPSVVIRDLRVQGGGMGTSTSQLWKQFNLTAINQALNEPLTSDEVAFNRESSPDLKKLSTYTIMFTPNVVGEASQMVFLDLMNAGHLPASFSIHMPNEREIELEQWCDEGEPTEEEVLYSAVVDEIKCFDIYPRVGSLLPGQTLTLNMAYHYTSLRFKGTHRLPILLRISQGKQFWLNLEGCTLNLEQPYLMPLAGPDEVVELFPVAIGALASEAPAQYTELMNPSDVDVVYEVDTSVLDKMRRRNHDYPVLLLDNPKGTIRAKSKGYLKWWFNPLERKTYNARIHVTYKGASQIVQDLFKFTLKALGYDLRSEDHHRRSIPEVNKGIAPPLYQVVRAPDTIAVLSEDKVSLGRLLIGTTSTRVVVLRSLLTDRNVEYAWDELHPLVHNSTVEFIPKFGVIGPHGFALVRIRVKAHCSPVIVSNCFTLKVHDAPIPKTAKSKGMMDHLKAKLADRANAPQLGVTHEPLVSRYTFAKSVTYEEVQEQLDERGQTMRHPHLPTSESRPPPPGPEGSPIRRVCLKNKPLTRVPSSRTIKSSRSFKTMSSTGSNAAGHEAPPEPMVTLMEVHLCFEVVPEHAQYLQLGQVEQDLRQKQLLPMAPHFAAPEHPHLRAQEGARRRSNGSGVTYFDDDSCLDAQGGLLVKEAFASLIRDVLSTPETDETIAALREEERVPYFAELKPQKPAYEWLAEALGMTREQQYQAPPDAVVKRLKELNVPCSFDVLEELIAQMVNDPRNHSTASRSNINKQQPKNTITNDGKASHSTVNAEENGATSTTTNATTIDLRRLAARMPVKMRNDIEQSLAVWASLERRRRRSSNLTAHLVSSQTHTFNRRVSEPYGETVGLEVDLTSQKSDDNHSVASGRSSEEEPASPRLQLPEDSNMAWGRADRRESAYRATNASQAVPEDTEARVREIVDKEALLDADCTAIIAATLEETLYNLTQEALCDQFDVAAQPRQYLRLEQPRPELTAS